VAGAGARVAVLAVAAMAALAGCEPWRCDFESHGACVEFETNPPDVHAAKQRMDRLLDLELPYWNLHKLDGWRILYRDTAQYECYLTARNDGCTDYINHTLSIRLRDEDGACFEAAELLHELGHYALGDPTHSNPLWKGVDDQFAPVVWDRPDAPRPCRDTFAGVRTGMWTVNIDGF
jgi:hypothetical protein